jgi:hypothetical protein
VFRRMTAVLVGVVATLGVVVLPAQAAVSHHATAAAASPDGSGPVEPQGNQGAVSHHATVIRAASPDGSGPIEPEDNWGDGA